jgi:FMN reductase
MALMALRSVVHALRGWPTPLGAGLNTAGELLDSSGNCVEPTAAQQLVTVGRQVAEFAERWSSESVMRKGANAGLVPAG